LGDAERVEIRDGTAKIAELPFCSAYSGASAEVVTDRAGVSFLLLRFGQGHGTNARSEYLSVYRIAAELDEYLRTPVSGPASKVDRWEYTYAVSPLPKCGIRIVLTLLHGGDGPGVYNPVDRVRVIDVGARTST
jgi:hypothetical protein